MNNEQLEKSQGLWILLWTMGGFGVNHLECEQNSGVTPETVVTDKITIPT